MTSHSGPSPGRPRVRRAVFACAVGLLLGCRSAREAAPAAPDPTTSSGLGPERVLTLERLVFHDRARGRDIPLKIYYPDARGPFPVIVFSHGALASKDDYAGLGQFWASHGYVSIHPSHADSMADGGYRGTLREAISDPVRWQNRPRDVSVVLDAMAHADRLAPELTGKLDLRRVGVAGHSFGAYTSGLLAGVTIHLPGRQGPQRFADPRVSAAVLLSPQGEGRLGLTSESWDHLRLPLLVMYGSLDFGPFGEPPSWRNEAFLKAPPGDKYDVELEGATHMRFAGGVVIAGDALDPIFQCVKLETLAFWNAFLKGEPGARQDFASAGLRACGAHAGHFAAK
jgi:predicted dienelactone hydrolase